MINDCIVLSCLIGWHVCFGQPEAVNFYPLVNNMKMNCAQKDNDVRLICETNRIFSTMIIKRANDEKPLNISTSSRKSAQFTIHGVDCSDMGVYQCIIDNVKIETTVIVLSDCPPLPCHQEDTNMTVYADFNTPLNISLCVLVFENIYKFININNISVRPYSTNNLTWSWGYSENVGSQACFRNVTIILENRNVTTEDYEGLSIKVYSSTHFLRFSLDYNIFIKTQGNYDNATSKASASTIRKVGYDDPTSQTSASKIQKDGEDEEEEEAQEDISTFLPPLLVIVGAVVITVVMIVRKEKRIKQRALATSVSSKEHPNSTGL